LQFTQDAGQTDAVFSEMKDLVGTIEKSKDLQNFLASPIIGTKKKISISAEIFAAMSPVTRNLIQLVIKQGRENHIANIGREFVKKVEDMRGVQRITLTSATPLSEENVKNILQSTSLVNHDSKFDVQSIIDPEIL